MILLALVTLILTSISFIFEYNYPILDLPEPNIGVFIFRYIHLWIGLYMLSFIFLSDYKLYGFVYLIIAIIIVVLSKLCKCCILSYCELQMYKGDMKYINHFHPCTYVFFREYHKIPLVIMSIIVCITFYYILFKMKITLIYKFCIGCIFGFMVLEQKLNINDKKYSETYLTTFL